MLMGSRSLDAHPSTNTAETGNAFSPSLLQVNIDRTAIARAGPLY